MSREQYQGRRFLLKTEEAPVRHYAVISVPMVLAINLIILVAELVKIMMVMGIALFLFLWLWDTHYLLWPALMLTLMLCIAICNRSVLYLRILKGGISGHIITGK